MTHTESRIRNSAARAAILAGATDLDVASQFNIGVGYAASFRTALGIRLLVGRPHGPPKPPPLPRGPIASNSTWAILAELISTSDTLAAIAQRRGISRERVRQIYAKAKGAGVGMKGRGRE